MTIRAKDDPELRDWLASQSENGSRETQLVTPKKVLRFPS